MTVQEKTVVSLVYQLFSTSQDGEDILLEERTVEDPLEFLFGHNVLVAKVEKTIENQTAGFQKQVSLIPEESFGPYRQDLQTWIPMEKFPKTVELKLGMKFQTQAASGEVTAVIVKEIQADKVQVDGNHPLAGLNLLFDLKIMRVRLASEEELIKKEVIPEQLH